MILAVHDVRRLAQPDSAASETESRYYRNIMRIGASRAAFLITISEFSKAEMEKHLRFEAPVAIVSEQPTGIAPVPVGTVTANEPRFLVVGALRKYKGLETVIAAVKTLGQPAVRVVFVGDDEGNREYMQALAGLAEASGVTEQIQMAGWISDEELRSLYGTSLGTVNPSNYEGYGLAVAESLAAGLPTIASDIPPHREIGGDAVAYFEQDDAAGLAGLMDELIRDPAARAGFAGAARSRHRILLEDDRPWAVALAAAIADLSGE